MEVECGLIKLKKIISDDATQGANSNAVEKIRGRTICIDVT